MTRARDVASSGGLVLLSTSTIGTAVTSVTVSNAFSSTYDAYKIIVSGGIASTTNFINFTFTGSAANYAYSYQLFSYLGVADTGNTDNFSSFFAAGGGSTNTIDFSCEILDPFLAKFTKFEAFIKTATNGGRFAGQHKSAVSYTGFTLTASTGTLTGGTIRVYGYKN